MNWLKANRLSVKDPFAPSTYDLSLNSSLEKKNKSNRSTDLGTPQKIKSNPSFSLEKINSNMNEGKKGSLTSVIKKKDQFRLPLLKKNSFQNPETIHENKQPESEPPQVFYQAQVYRALKHKDNTYIMSLARQHFQQTIQALRLTKNFKLPLPKKQIKLEKKSLHKKTIYLDLDETLIHTDERSNNYSVKLNFPIETGGYIQAGVRIRPFCHEFLTELAKFAEIIIFTASSSSYANVILDYLDPGKKLFSYRLYRNHCTLEKGFYIKDLRVVNRNLQDVAIVDNSAFSFLLQPENGIPILPFYHYSKDRELQTLLQFLKELVAAQDMRTVIRKTFFWDSYQKQQGDMKKIFMKRILKKQEQQKSTF